MHVKRPVDEYVEQLENIVRECVSGKGELEFFVRSDGFGPNPKCPTDFKLEANIPAPLSLDLIKLLDLAKPKSASASGKGLSLHGQIKLTHYDLQLTSQ